MSTEAAKEFVHQLINGTAIEPFFRDLILGRQQSRIIQQLSLFV